MMMGQIANVFTINDPTMVAMRSQLLRQRQRQAGLEPQT